MKIYVAGKFEDYLAVREVQEFLEKLGHEITFDWTPEAARGSQTYRLQSDKLANAEKDVAGVEECDALVALGHPELYGTMLEIGIAIADETPVFLVGTFRDSVFWSLPLVTKLKSPLQLLDHFGPAFDR